MYIMFYFNLQYKIFLVSALNKLLKHVHFIGLLMAYLWHDPGESVLYGKKKKYLCIKP